MIRGLNDGYGAMTRTEQQFVTKYVPGMSLDAADDSLNYVYEITAPQIRQLMDDKDSYTYIDIWVPWCTTSNCKPLSYYQKLRTDLRKQRVQVLLVSDQYVISTIQKLRQRFDYTGKIFVIDHARYGGQNRGKEVRSFAEDLTNIKPAPDSLAFANYFLFKGDSLVKYSMENDVESTFQ
jgi:hypothetical protein